MHVGSLGTNWRLSCTREYEKWSQVALTGSCCKRGPTMWWSFDLGCSLINHVWIPQRKLHKVQRVRCLLASQRFRLDIPLQYLTSKDMVANRALAWPKHFTLLPFRIKHGNGKSPVNGAVINGKNIFHEFSTAMFDYRRLSLWKPT